MEPYWSGFSDPIAFPVYTGSNGVSTRTQHSAGYPTPSSTTSSSSSSSTTQNSVSSTSSATSNPSDHHGNSAPVRPTCRRCHRWLGIYQFNRGSHRRLLPPPKTETTARTTSAAGTWFPTRTSCAKLSHAHGAIFEHNGPSNLSTWQHEIVTQYNKPEGSGQSARLPAMQPIQPEDVSVAQQPSKAELDSHLAGHQGKGRECL